MTGNDTKKVIDQVRPASYDGIQEYDNDLPRWWVWLFYLTGVYAVVYLFADYMFGVQLPPVPHEPTGVIAAAGPKSKEALEASQVDEKSLLRAALKDSAVVKKGGEVFAGRCAPCHAATGGGLIGPNLTDDNWIHGGSLTEIKHVIENGVVEKGMLAWKSMMSQDDIRAVTVYIRSIRGTNPSGAKAAEGLAYTGEE